MKNYIEIIKNLTVIIEKQQEEIDRYKHMLEPENVAVISCGEGFLDTKTLKTPKTIIQDLSSFSIR